MTDDEEVTRLRRENEALRAAVREAQWAGEGGYREESACPFCGASPYIGQPPFHEEGCIVAQFGLDDDTDDSQPYERVRDQYTPRRNHPVVDHSIAALHEIMAAGMNDRAYRMLSSFEEGFLKRFPRTDLDEGDR